MFAAAVDRVSCSGVYCYSTLPVSGIRAIETSTVIVHLEVCTLLEVFSQLILLGVVLLYTLLETMNRFPCRFHRGHGVHYDFVRDRVVTAQNLPVLPCFYSVDVLPLPQSSRYHRVADVYDETAG